MKTQCLQDEGDDCSSGYVRAFVWDFEGSQRVPKVPSGVPRGLELIASIPGPTFGKEEVGVRLPPLASSLPQVLLMKD